ncbi:MAG TPA: hypothetical protein VGN43_05445 [Steroidobacteraceae bacterium]|nr:hypothetical protein [Steroidobacteraceae bacterium]
MVAGAGAAPPALKAVGIDPGSTALIVMDISTKTCSSAHRPRCVATLPAVARLVREARASGALVPYSLIGHDKRSDIPKPFRGFEVIVPIDGMSSGSLYGEQSTAWYLAHAPRVSQHTTLTAVDRMKF